MLFPRQVNKELLAAMEVSTDEIGKVFLELAPYLKFYSTYANDFEKATNLGEEWTDTHKVRTQFLILRAMLRIKASFLAQLKTLKL